MNGSSENLITRINYSGRVKGLFGIAMFGIPALALNAFEDGPSGKYLPLVMQGRINNLFAPAVHASISKLPLGENFPVNFSIGLMASCGIEIAQKIGIMSGVYDEGDFKAFFIGALGYAIFEGVAKIIHDSGMSLPIYRLLGMQHRKFG